MKLLIANWKMNPNSAAEAIRLARATALHSVVLCPPFVFIETAAKILKAKSLKLKAGLGAQDVFLSEPRAATGEISPTMLKKLGVSHVIIGHSERRRLLGEKDELINKKVLASLKAGLKVVLCVGEPKRDLRNKIYDLRKAKNYVKGQLEKDLKGVLYLKSYALNLIIAYEPIWAIGTGIPDNPESASEMISFIKKILNLKSYGLNHRVLYGGSVTAKNAAGFLKRPEIDGALVGGASLSTKEFRKIYETAHKR